MIRTASAKTLSLLLFFFNHTATTEIYTLSLHDALPISTRAGPRTRRSARAPARGRWSSRSPSPWRCTAARRPAGTARAPPRAAGLPSAPRRAARSRCAIRCCVPSARACRSPRRRRRVRSPGAGSASLVVREVGVLARAAGLAVLAVGKQVEVAFLARRLVDVGLAPRIERRVLAQIRAGPFRLVRGTLHERVQAELGARVMPGIEPVLVERLLERVDLRPGGIHLGLPDLPEIARRHQPGEQADDHHHHEQLDQCEAVFATHGSFSLAAILLRPDGQKRALVADSWDLLTPAAG